MLFAMNHTKLRLFLAVSSILLFCGIATPASVDVPQLRLPAIATPLRYRVDLTIVPTNDRFSGVIEIDLNIARATSFLWLNANELKFNDTSLQQGNQSITAHAVQSQ